MARLTQGYITASAVRTCNSLRDFINGMRLIGR